MKKTFAETFPSGEVRADVTSVTLVNNTAKTNNVTVPDDTIWKLQSIRVMNPDDVARAISLTIYKEAAKTSRVLHLDTRNIAASAVFQWPNNGTGGEDRSNIPFDLVLFAGNTIEITWAAGGASSGGTIADAQVVFYRRLLKT